MNITLLSVPCQWSISCTEYSVFKTDQRQVVLDKEQHIGFFSEPAGYVSVNTRDAEMNRRLLATDVGGADK